MLKIIMDYSFNDAAVNGHTDIVKVLLANGANINAMANNGCTALMGQLKKVIQILLMLF